jgi:dienelactone hydrolase
MRPPSPHPKLLAIWLPGAALLAASTLAQAQELVHYPSVDADLTKGAPTAIEAYLFKPAGAGPFPAIVGLHGCGGLFNSHGKMQARETEWAATLTAHGYVVLYPESFASRHVGSGCIGTDPAVKPWRERARDAYGALLYLQSLAFVIAERIGLLGWSHGGGTVMFTIAKGAEARPHVLPHGDFRAAIAFYPGWCHADTLGPDWSTAIPTLVLQGASDDWTQAGPCKDLVEHAAAHGTPIDITIYPGSYHDFDWPGDAVHTFDVGTSWDHGAHVKIVHMGFNQDAHDAAVVRAPAFFDAHLKN